MAKKREVRTCSRCRQLKLRCDRAKPSCQRCTEAEASCSLTPSDAGTPTAPGSSTSTSTSRQAKADKRELKGDGIVKKRQRAHLSCDRCYRLKVKCDRDLPCARCRDAGWGRHCSYAHQVPDETEKEKQPSNTRHDNTAQIAAPMVPSWHAQRRSPTHWEHILLTLKSEARDADIPLCSIFAEAASHRRNGADNANDSTLPSNFPFNSPEAAKYASLEGVHALLQSHRDEADAYVDGYLALYQPIHPIIDVAVFCSMVDVFWNDPNSVDASWLATFLMVLALGCLAVSRDQGIAADLCLAAEACLGKTLYMVQPDVSTVRTLCLMVVAKQTANATCSTFDSCWTFLGVVMRAAISMGLNKQIRPLPNESAAVFREWQTGQVLWSLVVYFCIQTAAITGKQPLISADELLTKDASPFYSSGEPLTTDPWIAILEAYPTICHILVRVNSTTEMPFYDEVVLYDHQVRRFMVLLDTIRGKPSLHATLDIFFRRVLVTLHRRHALDIGAALCSPVSYWSSLECSLAVLVHHRDLCEHEGKRHNNTDLLGRLFKLDFFAAMLTACLCLLRRDAAPLASKHMVSLPPRRIIMDTLQVCVGIWEREIRHSVCFRIGHMFLSSILTSLSL